MAEKGLEEDGLSKASLNFSPSVRKMQDVMKRDPTGGWEKCWEDGLTPWDLGRPTPIVEHLIRKGILPNGRALVPGCGRGHDVVALACIERYVIGLDISQAALKKAEKLSSSSPNANHLAFLKEDFFSWHPSGLFDLIFDYTFFCAIEPSMRPAWGASKTRWGACNTNVSVDDNTEKSTRLKTPYYSVVKIWRKVFPCCPPLEKFHTTRIDDHIGGPPFKAYYEKVLCPLGFQAISIEDNELAVGSRKGMEKLGRWKKVCSPPL